MKQSDTESLAHQFMINAVKTKAGQNIWIEYIGEDAKILAEACAKEVKAVGATPLMVDSSAETLNNTIGKMSEKEIEAWGQANLEKTKTVQGYIRIKDDEDESKVKFSDEVRIAYKKARREYTDYRVKNTDWLVVAAPTEAFAKACNMEKEPFEDFYKDACLVNYSAMAEAVAPLTKIMTEGKNVRVYAPNQETDLTFSIEGIPAIPCTGDHNIPDGECFTAPVKNSMNGTVKFGMSVYDGQKFNKVKLEIKDGRIEKAEAENDERTTALNKILDTDEGARYFGEFALNFNPFVKHATGNILFDEKIDGGFHLAAGNAYDRAPNGNQSSIHWDMVQIQRPEYGGGEIYIDDQLIRKDGIFVIPELKALNPENLKIASQKTTVKKMPKPL